MEQDFIRQLGHLALGTRLKRLGDRMQQQTQVLLASHDIHVAAAQLPLLGAIDRLGSASIGTLAQALGIAQPGVTRLVGKLEQAGLLETVPTDRDRRVRTVQLTPAGQALVAHARAAAWPVVEAAVVELCGANPVLPVLTALEEALEAKPLSERAKLIREKP
jgi:DNA-binding MarR family transcriptional regulator